MKKTKLLTAVLSINLVLLGAACTPAELEKSMKEAEIENKKEADKEDKIVKKLEMQDTIENPEEQKFKIPKVGGKIKVDFVQRFEEGEYHLGITNKNGELKWRKIFVNTNQYHYKVYYRDDIESSYIERGKNYVARPLFGKPFTREYQYNIYIAKSSITGGRVERDCGKNCTEKINTEILDN